MMYLARVCLGFGGSSEDALWREIGYVCEVQVLACYNLCALEKNSSLRDWSLLVARGGEGSCAEKPRQTAP